MHDPKKSVAHRSRRLHDQSSCRTRALQRSGRPNAPVTLLHKVLGELGSHARFLVVVFRFTVSVAALGVVVLPEEQRFLHASHPGILHDTAVVLQGTTRVIAIQW